MSPADQAFAAADHASYMAGVYAVGGTVAVIVLFLVIWAPGALNARNARAARNAERYEERIDRALKQRGHSTINADLSSAGKRVAR